jgi:starch phosphorylase
VEIREQVGEENFFLFGKTTPEIAALRGNYHPWEQLAASPLLQEAISLVENGHFSNDDRELFRPLVENLTGSDPFFVLADFDAYMCMQDVVSHTWTDRRRWNRMSLLNTARTIAYFSSDRSIGEYNERIWKVPPLSVQVC